MANLGHPMAPITDVVCQGWCRVHRELRKGDSSVAVNVFPVPSTQYMKKCIVANIHQVLSMAMCQEWCQGLPMI